MAWDDLSECSQDNIRAFVDLIQGAKEPEIIVVKVKGKDILITAEKLVQVSCKTNVGYVDEVRQMIFSIRSEQAVEDLQYANTVAYLRKVIKNCFKKALVNNSNHNIICF